MNFLADESCDGPVIRRLREAGHDVVAIAEVAKGATDEQVLGRAAMRSAYSSRRIGILANWCMRAVGRQVALFWSGFIAAPVSLSQRPWSRRWRS